MLRTLLSPLSANLNLLLRFSLFEKLTVNGTTSRKDK